SLLMLIPLFGAPGGRALPILVSKLARIACPRQDHDDVSPLCQSVADYRGFARDVAQFLYAPSVRAEDRSCLPPRCPPNRALRFFATAIGCRNPDSSRALLGRRFHFSEMASPPGQCRPSQLSRSRNSPERV